MRRKIVVGLVVLLMLAVAAGAFAAGETKSKTYPWMASFDNPGQLNLYGSVGFYGLGISINAGPEFMVAKFEPGGIPLELGVMARGVVGFSSFLGLSWIDWAVPVTATLHWSVDFGSPWKFDWYIGAGLSISGSTGSYWSTYGLGTGAIGFGFASADGVAWHFSNNLALVVEYAYTPYLYAAGIGLKFAL